VTTQEINIQEQEKALYHAVITYVEYKERIAILRDGLSKLAPPPRPHSASSLSELYSYKEATESYESRRKQMENRKDEALRKLLEVKERIIKLIPVSKCWVKVGGWAVSTYFDTWGGGHMEVEVRPWSDNLPEQRDRTYYP